jgi:hypothetical protein
MRYKAATDEHRTEQNDFTLEMAQLEWIFRIHQRMPSTRILMRDNLTKNNYQKKYKNSSEKYKKYRAIAMNYNEKIYYIYK